MQLISDAIDLHDIYRFLAQAMRYPDQNRMNGTFFKVLINFLDELGWENDSQELRSAIHDRERFVEALQVENTRLFINAVPHVVAPPYASLYMEKQGQFYGNIAEKTKDFYREMGYEPALQDDLPDSLITELEFLALLEKEDNDLADSFLNKYFRLWFPRFRDRVLTNTINPYYKTIVRLIDFFTMEEH